MAKKQKIDTEGLDDTVDAIKEKFGEGAIMKLGEVRSVDIEAISTHSLSLDLALGVGGLPKGRIIEVFGPESSGKTTVALHATAEVQKKGEVAAFIDAEHALDPDYAKKLGVKLNDLLISQPDTGEQALDIVEALVRSNKVALIVVDSVAALTPRAEIEGEMGNQQIGLQARLMSQALRKLTAIAAKSGTTIIFLNQTRMKIATFGFGNPETTPGGKALKFYASVRIELRPIAKIKRGESIVGNRIRAKVVKNKVAPPFRVSEFDIIYNEGIPEINDIINTALRFGVIDKKANTLEFDGVKLGSGTERAKLFLSENAKIIQQIKKKIVENWKEEEQR
jgi:recombination protein RecA